MVLRDGIRSEIRKIVIARQKAIGVVSRETCNVAVHRASKPHISDIDTFMSILLKQCLDQPRQICID